MVAITMRFALTPLATAADGFMPVARRSKPKRVRPSRNQYAMPAAIATKMKSNTRLPVPGNSWKPVSHESSGRIGVETISPPGALTPSRSVVSR